MSGHVRKIQVLPLSSSPGPTKGISGQPGDATATVNPNILPADPAFLLPSSFPFLTCSRVFTVSRGKHSVAANDLALAPASTVAVDATALPLVARSRDSEEAEGEGAKSKEEPPRRPPVPADAALSPFEVGLLFACFFAGGARPWTFMAADAIAKAWAPQERRKRPSPSISSQPEPAEAREGGGDSESVITRCVSLFPCQHTKDSSVDIRLRICLWSPLLCQMES